MSYRLTLMRRGMGIALALTLLLTTACSDRDQSAAPRATVPPATSTTTMAAPADPYAIPETIDIAYVQRVIDKLYEIDGDATRIIAARQELVPEAARILQAIYLPDELNRQLKLWGDAVAQGLEPLKDPPGNIAATITQLIVTDKSCISFRAERDFRDVLDAPPAPRTNTIVLKPKAQQQDPAHINPTPFMIDEQFVNDPTAQPCP
ncbi:MAG TPA: hypothetical protein VM345_02620 [Acidimicrobiales bacterium]|jgi:hypothetical protein|nr:hypothetical protein [Acidimicrobiales bacterium]